MVLKDLMTLLVIDNFCYEQRIFNFLCFYNISNLRVYMFSRIEQQKTSIFIILVVGYCYYVGNFILANTNNTWIRCGLVNAEKI